MKRRGRPKIEKINFNAKRFQEALDYNHLSLRQLDTDNVAMVSEKTIRRAKKDGKINPDILNRLGKRLNVDPLYLSGVYDNISDSIAKNEKEAIVLKDQLHVKNHPYILSVVSETPNPLFYRIPLFPKFHFHPCFSVTSVFFLSK